MLTLTHTSAHFAVKTAGSWCALATLSSVLGYAMEERAGSQANSIRFENQPKDPAKAAVE